MRDLATLAVGVGGATVVVATATLVDAAAAEARLSAVAAAVVATATLVDAAAAEARLSAVAAAVVATATLVDAAAAEARLSAVAAAVVATATLVDAAAAEASRRLRTEDEDGRSWPLSPDAGFDRRTRLVPIRPRSERGKLARLVPEDNFRLPDPTMLSMLLSRCIWADDTAGLSNVD